MVVWLLTGLWHGASWNFILWGVFYAIILLTEKQFLHKYIEKLPRFLAWLLMFIVVNIGWLIFRVENMGDLRLIITSFFSPTGTLSDFISNNFSIVPYYIFVIIGLIFMFPISKKIVSKLLSYRYGRLALDIILCLLFVLCIFALINSSYNPFIYFRF